MSDQWNNSPILLLDTETTGVNPATARVWELGLISIGQGGLERAESVLCHPGGPIPDEVAALCALTPQDRVHITAARLFDDGAWDRLSAACNILGPDGVAVAYNGFGYDLPLLDAECQRAGLPNPLRGHRLLDPLILVRHFRRAWRHRGLDEVRDRLGIPLPVAGAHRALGDCWTTRAVLRWLASEVGLPSSWSELEALQARAMAHQQADDARFGYWLYTDEAGSVFMGAGKYCGFPIGDVDRGYIRFVLGKEKTWDVPLSDEARVIFNQRLSGR